MSTGRKHSQRGTAEQSHEVGTWECLGNTKESALGGTSRARGLGEGVVRGDMRESGTFQGASQAEAHFALVGDDIPWSLLSRSRGSEASFSPKQWEECEDGAGSARQARPVRQELWHPNHPTPVLVSTLPGCLG